MVVGFTDNVNEPENTGSVELDGPVGPVPPVGPVGPGTFSFIVN